MANNEEKNEQPTPADGNEDRAPENNLLEEVEVHEDPQVLARRVRELQDEKDQLFARLQRALADMQNFQKRAIKERQESVLRAELGAIERFLLPVLDDLDRALKAADEHGYKKDDPLFHGVNLVLRHAFGQLKQLNIEPIDAEGKLFDPLYHEAVMELPDANLPENTIVQVVNRGYTQGGKTIRPARVVIAKPPQVQSKNANDNQPNGELTPKDKEK